MDTTNVTGSFQFLFMRFFRCFLYVPLLIWALMRLNFFFFGGGGGGGGLFMFGINASIAHLIEEILFYMEVLLQFESAM